MESKFFSDLSKVFGGAFHNMGALKHETEQYIRGQMQHFFQNMDMVRREEFEALRLAVQSQADEIARLKAALNLPQAEKPATKQADAPAVSPSVAPKEKPATRKKSA